MKQVYRDISYHAMPYCTKHNRLFPHYTVGWLTPARPEELHVFPAPCDVCKGALCLAMKAGQRVPDAMSA